MEKIFWFWVWGEGGGRVEREGKNNEEVSSTFYLQP